jgi:hypothetical protein
MRVVPFGEKAVSAGSSFLLVPTRIGVRSAFCATLFWLALALAPAANSQTTLLFEGFEGIFPAGNGWSVGDANATSGTAYWDDVTTAYGSVPAHTGSWKGYCAAITNGTPNTTAVYTNNMQAFMSRTLNLAGFTGANLDLWYAIPSIETCCDRLRIYVDDTNLLWVTGTPQPDWALVALPLNNYLGGSHTVKIEFDSDFSVVAEGAYLDDIVVRASTQPFVSSFSSVSNINYTGYVLASDTIFGRSNIQAQAIFNVENFTGTNTTFTNVMSFRLINASNSTAHPLYDFGNANTNAAYTYNITNIVTMVAGTNVTVTNVAYLRPAAWMSQFVPFYVECRMLTNGVVAQTLTTSPTNYYHFTNTVSGDLAYNALLNLTGAAWSRTYVVQTIPGQDTFQVNASYEVRRWDDFNSPVAAANVPIVFDYTLRDSAGNIVPLVTSSQTFLQSINSYFLFFFSSPAFLSTSRTLDIQPAVQLDSVNRTYYLTVTISHTNNPASGQRITANTRLTTTNELLHFNGNLFFGSIGTTMSSLGFAPPVNPPSGGFIPTVLNSVGGFVTGVPNHTYTGAGPLGVNLNSAGDAFVTAGSVVLSAPAPDTDSVANVNFQRGPVTLSPSGATSDVKVTLPTGFGYRTNDTSSQVVFSMIQFNSVPLNASLDPASDLTFSPGVTVFAVEENKPAWLPTTSILWHISSGRFDLTPFGPGAFYVRRDEYSYLHSVSNLLVDPPNMGDKRSNDKYWLELLSSSGMAMVRPDANSAALLTANFNFGPGGFRAHFPYDTAVEWSANGTMKVTDDLVISSSSALSGAAMVGVPYTRDCPDCGGAGAGIDTPTITSSNNLFTFTRDGGLIAGGPTTASVDLQWGYIGTPTFDYAQSALSFMEGAFHMPGAFLRGDQNLLADVQGPTTILYTGFAVSNLSVIERPLSSAYSDGFADYAGLNFRCLADSAHGARSTIAGQKNINWQLDARSKYYVRYAGVTGIHEAVPGTFPSNLTLWGYMFTFTSYGLSYRDSQNIESVTDGAITLPYPAEFVQGFDHMKFSCLGAPLGGDVPNGDGFKVMSYWAADFKTHSIQFKTKNGCSPTEGYLVLGIEGYASHVNKPLYGCVGFFASGDQIPRSFGLSGVDSRLKVPNVIKIEGPNKTTYSFTPITDVYYNTHSNAPPAPTAGWVSIFGKLDVPFFENMQLHLQTSCHTNGVAASNAPIYLSGGWPRPGSSDPNFGWLDGASHTPFEVSFFDPANAGWPGSGGGLTIANYRDNQNDEMFHPRAQRLWLGVVEFNYPLSWNTTLRSFKSWKQSKDKLLVIEVQHEIKYMDAKQAEIDFGAQYDGLPSISIANLAFNAIDEATGVGEAIVKAAAQPVEDVLSAGLDEMNQLLDTQMKRLMDGVFDRTVDPIIDNFYRTLSNQWAGVWGTLTIPQRQQFVVGVNSNLANLFIGNGMNPVANNLTTALKQIGSASGSVSNLIGQIQGYLRDATNAICSIVSTINTTTNGQALGSNVVGLIAKVDGNRPVAPKLVQSLVGDIAPQFLNAVLGPALSNVLAQVEPALEQVSDTLNQTKSTITQVESQLEGVGGFVGEIDNTLKSFSGQLTNVSVKVSLSVTQYFGKLDYTIDNPFTHLSAADIKKFIRQQIEDQFFDTDASAQIQTALRQRLYDIDAAMRQQIDSVFQQLNGVMRDLISQSLAEVDKTINGLLGDVSDVIGAGQINGHALIDGDSLKCLRIDGHFQWKAPDAMEFSAFLQIKEYDSDGTPGCSSGKTSTTEVTIGADMVSLDWISPDLKANIETKFTFDGGVPFPVNLAGQLELIGDLSFETFVLHDLAAALAFGKYENYLALKGGVRFNGYDFAGAIFFGRTCTLDPLKLIDPQVAEVLGNPPFTGAYVYAQGWLPVSELVLGIPASCIFEISAGVGAGAFYFAEGPTYGGKMFLGVSGELLCIVSIEGDITMIGVKHGDDLRFAGHGHFEADVGPCPFCITVSKSVDVTYQNNSWSIE